MDSAKRFWDFGLQVFCMDQFPSSPYTIRAVSNFLENSQRYLELKVHHRAGVIDTSGKWKISSIKNFFIIFWDTFGKVS